MSAWMLYCLAAVLTTACGSKNGELANNSLGISAAIVSGNSQKCVPAGLCKMPLTIRLTGTQTQSAVTNFPVTFTETDNNGQPLQIISTNVTTDSTGQAQTQIKLPSVAGQTYKVTATATGTSASTTFTIYGDQAANASSLVIVTTHNNAEVAGVPFGFNISVNDQFGQLATSFNETVSLIFQYQTQASWTKQTSVLPAAYTCTFQAGLCTTPTSYIITDSRQSTLLTAGAGPNSALASVFNMPITVTSGPTAAIVVATKIGGPTANATVVQTPVSVTTDATTQSYSAAFVDIAGNYLSDDTDAVWSTTANQISSNFTTPTSGVTVSFNPWTVVANAPLKATSATTNSSATATLSINPGLPKSLKVTTQHNENESAGVPFTVIMQALDSHANVIVANADGSGGYSGSPTTTITMNNASIGPTLTTGCARFLLTGEPFYTINTSGANANCGSRTYTQPFVNGTSVTEINAAMMQANAGATSDGHGHTYPATSSFSPTITVNTNQFTDGAGNVLPALSGTSPVVTVNRGAADHFSLFTAPGTAEGDLAACDLNTQNQSASETQSCVTRNAGATASMFYPALVDVGGNFLSNDTPTWTFTGSYFGGSQWSVTSGNPATDASFAPTIAGWGFVTLADATYSPSVSTTIGGNTSQSPIDHFLISVNDGVDTVNILSVLDGYTLTIQAKDALNNTFALNGPYSLNISYVFTSPTQTASPKGTPASIPLSGLQTYNFVNGVATVTLGSGGNPLRLPNATDSVSITVTDGNAHTSNVLTPSLVPGPLASVKIRTAVDNGGVSITSTDTDPGSSYYTFTIDNTPQFYVAQYDSELNYLGADSAAVWSGTITSLGTVSTPGTVTSLAFTTAGTGVLSVASGGKTASSRTITVNPGAPYSYAVATQHAGTETAGVPFTFTVKVLDQKGNLVTTYNGNRSITWNVTTGNSWGWNGWANSNCGTACGSGGWPYSGTPTQFGVPSVPGGSLTCTFTNGICTTGNYTLTDARATAAVSISDGILVGVNGQAVTVQPGPKTQFWIANKTGGPSAGASVLCLYPDATDPGAELGWCTTPPNSVTLTQTYSRIGAGYAPVTFVAVALDASGNYVQDAPYAVWSTTAQAPGTYISPSSPTLLTYPTIAASSAYITGQLSALSGSSVTFTPKYVGDTSSLVISDGGGGGGLPPFQTFTFNVKPSAPTSVAVVTEHQGAEQAGIPFSVYVTPKDSFGNYISVNIQATGSTVTLNSSNSLSNMVSSGCGALFEGTTTTSSGGFWANRSFTSPCAASSNYTLNFQEAPDSLDVFAVLNDATVTPTVSVTIPAITGFSTSSITGTSAPITVSKGPISVINLHTGSYSGPAAFEMPGVIQNQVTLLNSVVGSPSVNYFAAHEDAGGNVLDATPQLFDWNATQSFYAEFSPYVNTNSSTFTPTATGFGSLTVTDGTNSTTFYGTTSTLSVDHYTLTASDGTDTTNNLSVLDTFTLTIVARDQYNNVVPLGGSQQLQVTTTGDTASPKGTAAVAPNDASLKSYTFTNGVTTITALRLPNLSNIVTFTATDGTHTGSLTPTLLGGLLNSIQIRNASLGGGSDLNNATATYTLNQSPSFYLAEYDSELNYIGTTSGTWTWSNTAVATAVASGNYTVLTPIVAGTGNLSVTYNTFSATTSTVTITPGNLAAFVVSTTHANTETAGTAFGFQVEVVDSGGDVVTSYTATRTINFAFDTWFSWNGSAPTLPGTGYSCSFTNGVCTLPSSYILTDARRKTVMTVTDGSGNLQTFVANITVNAGAKKALVITNASGNPNGPDGIPGNSDDVQLAVLSANNTFELCTAPGMFTSCSSPETYSIDNPTAPITTLHAAAIDAVGNYVEDPSAYVSWAGNQSYISSYITPSGSTLNYVPTIPGTNGQLIASGGSLTPASIGISTYAGSPKAFRVATQHGGSGETPGSTFSVIISTVDSKGNLTPGTVSGGTLTPYSGSVNMTFTFAADASAPPVSGGCGRMESTWYWDNFDVPNFTSDSCAHSMSYPITFSNGVADTSYSAVWAVLSDATSVSPTITTSVAANQIGTFPAMTGTSPVIPIVPGAAAWIMPHLTLGNHGDFICNNKIQQNWGNVGYNCLSVNVGSSAVTYYAAYEDAGGNFLSNPSNITWTATEAWAGNWTAGPAQSSTFTPSVGGEGYLALTDGTLTTNFSGVTNYGALDHFVLSASDGQDSPNSISVAQPYTLTITAQDAYNNTLPINNSAVTNLSLGYTFNNVGQTASPKGTAAVFPAGTQNTSGNTITTTGMSLNEVNGVITIPSLRLANYNNQVSINITDGTHTAKTALVPTMIAGAATTLNIRNADGGTGTNLTGGTDTLSASQGRYYYLAMYDSEQNYIPGTVGTWSFSNPAIGSISPSSGTATDLTPVTAGTGSLSVSSSGLSAVNVGITVTAGNAVALKATTTHGGTETAGTPFGFTISVVDNNGLVVSSVNETDTITWNGVSNWLSWTGQAPTLPSGSMSCTFTNGVCTTPQTYVVTDARRPYTMSITDSTQSSLTPAFLSVTTNPNTKTNLVIANLSGGPSGVDGNIATTSDNAQIFANNTICDYQTADACSIVAYTSDSGGPTLHAYATDAYGNYIEAATYAVWSTTGSYLGSQLSATSGATSTVSGAKTGTNGTVKVSGSGANSGLTPYSITMNIDPGAPSHLLVLDQNGGTEYPGQGFDVTVDVVDAHNNIVGQTSAGAAGYSGTFTTTISFAGDASAPATSGGCGEIYESSLGLKGAYYSSTIPYFPGSPCGLSYSASLSYINGTATLSAAGYLAMLWDATSVSPTISARFTNGSSTFSGTSSVIAISPGAPDHLALYNQANNHPACQVFVITNNSDTYYCFYQAAGSNAATYYVAVEDAGGNVLSTPADTTWSATGTYVSDWSLLGANVSSATFTPAHSGAGMLTLKEGSFTTNLYGVTTSASTAQYAVWANDGTDPNNIVNATAPYTVYIESLDQYGNPTSFNGTASITVSESTGTFHSSGAGTAPILPPSTAQTLTFTNGIASYTNIRTPNTVDSGFTFSVTDGTHTGTSGTIAINAGAATTLSLCTTSGCPNGSVISGTTTSPTTDAAANYYVSLYDAEKNTVAGSSSITWSGLTGLGSFSTTSGSSTTFTPSTTGNGTLTATYSSLTTSATVDILPGALDHFGVVTQDGGNETAGTPFTVTVTMYDHLGKVLSNFNSTQNVSVSVINNNCSNESWCNSIPAGGNLTFTNGVLSGQSFTLYNSGVAPTIQYSTVVGGNTKVGQAAVNLASAAFNHFYVPSANGSFVAGTSNTWTVWARDRYGNTITTGANATAQVDLFFTSTLTGQAISSNTLGSPTITAGPPLTLTGNLSAGTGSFTATATQTGYANVRAQMHGSSPPSANLDNYQVTVLPVSTINTIGWKPGYAPPTSYVASSSTPMTLFRVELLDVYGNEITTDNTDQIDLSLAQGTRTLQGTLSEVVGSGEALFSNIVYNYAETIILKAALHTNSAISVTQTINVTAGVPYQTIVVLPNQNFNPGYSTLASAVTNSPNNENVGASYNAKIYAVDSGFNVVTSYSGPVWPIVQINGVTDTNFTNSATSSSPASFSAGVANFTLTDTTAGSNVTVTAGSYVTTNNPSSSFSVLAGSASQIVLGLAGQTLNQGAQSSATAFTGTASSPTVGTPFTVNAWSTDSYYNIVSSTLSVGLNLSDSFGSSNGPRNLSGGTTSFNVTYESSGPGSIVPTSTLGTNLSTSFTVNSGTATQTIAILPNQVYHPGASSLASAVTGVPTTQTAGNPFTVTVRAVDANFNTVTGYSTTGGRVSLSLTDPNATAPAITDFSNGVATFSVTDITAGSAFSVTPGSPLSTNQVSTAYNVNPGSPTATIVVLPNQTYSPGKTSLATAVTGSPTAVNAGTTYGAVKVYEVDSYYNTVQDSTTSLGLTTNDPNATNPAPQTLSNGTTTFTNVTNYTAGTSRTLTASGGSYTNRTSNNYTVNPLSATKLIAIMPGQTYNPGAQTLGNAIQNSASAQTAGTAYTAHVYAVDNYYNTVPSVSASVSLALSDTVATTPSASSFSSGAATFSVTPITASSGQTITPSSSSLTGVPSSTFTVNPASPYRLIALPPGFNFTGTNQTWSNAITGAGNIEVAGTPFSPTVYAIDNYANVITSDSSTIVHLGTSDPNDTEPQMTLSSGVAVFNGGNQVSPRTSGSSMTMSPSVISSSYSYTPVTSSGYAVHAAAPSLLLVQAPGMTLNPGATSLATAFTGTPLTEVVNSPYSVTVYATDAYYNISDGSNGGTAYSNSVAMSSATDASITGNATITNGQGTFTVTNTVANANSTLQAAKTGMTTDVSKTYTVSPGGASKLAFITSPSSTSAGSSLGSIQVAIQDAGGNTITSSSDSVTIAIGNNPSGGSLSGTIITNAVNGIASFPGLSINAAGNGYTLTASSGSYTGATTSSFNITAGTASKLAFTTQPPASSTAGATWSNVVVTAQDSYGNTVTGYSASVTLGPSSGSLGGTVTVSASGGVATFGNLSMSTAGTGYTLTAYSGPLTAGTSSTFTITPASANKLAFTTQTTGGTAGVAWSTQPVVTVQDTYGNTVNSSSASITIAPSSGTLNGTTTVTASSGVATFTGISINTAANGYTLTATSSPSYTAATSSAFNVTAAAASKLAFTTQPGGGSGGTAWTTQPVVTIQDTFGNTVTSASNSISLTIANNPSGGTLFGTASVAASSGVATFSGLSINTIGTGYTLSASGAGFSTTSSAFNIVTGSATKLAFTTQPGGGSGGIAWGAQPVVVAQDAGGNTVTSYSASVSLAIANNPSGGTLWGTAAVSASSGTATFSGLSINSAGTGYTLTATSGSLTTATSSAFNITSGTANKLAFTVQPGTNTAGAAWSNIQVTVEDAGGNTVTGSSASISIGIGTNAGGGTLSGTTIVGASSGIATFSTLSINAIGTGYTLTASSSGLTTATSSTFNITSSTAAKLGFSTQPGGGTGGTAWSTQPVVVVQDAYGNTVSGSSASIALTITSNPSGGTLLGTSTVSASNGVATFAGLSINTAGTGYTLTAASGSLTPITSSAFNIVVGTAAKLAFTTQPGGGTGGTAWGTQPAVIVQDAGGNTVTGSSASINLIIANNPSGGTLSGTSTVSASSGSAAFSGLSINKAGTGYTLAASSSGLTGATSSAFNISVGSATKLAFSTQPGGGAAGATWSTQPVVVVQDAGGNTVTSSSVSIALTPSASTLNGSTTISASSGSASFAGLSMNTVGTYTLTAASTGLASATSGTLNITANTAAKLAFTTQPSGGTAGATWSTQPVVTVQDAYGNTVTSSSASIALTPSGGTLNGTATVAAVNGVATFSGLSMNGVASGLTLGAASGSLNPATSSSFNITPSAAAKLAFTTQPGGGTAGSTWGTQPVVLVQDAYGNTVTGSSATVGLTPSSGSLGGTTSVAAVNGVATFSGLSMTLAGNFTLSAASSGLTSATSSSYTITASSATKLGFTTQPGGGAGGATWAAQPAVAVQDAYGNTVSSSSASIMLTPSSSSLSGTTTVSASNGIANFSGLSMTLAGAYTLSAASNGLSTATSSSFNITAATATKLAFSSQPASTTAGAAWSNIVVLVQDTYGNTVTGYSASVSLAPSSNSLSGTTSVNASSGVATFTSLSMNAAGTGYTLSANSGSLAPATSNPYNISAAGANHLVLITGNNNTGTVGTQVSTNPTVEVVDAYANPISGIAVSFSSSSGSVGSSSVNTNASGQAATTFTLGNTAGTQTLTASATVAGSPSSVNFTETATAGAAAQLAVITQPVANQTTGKTFQTQPVIQIQDSHGNPLLSNSSTSISLTPFQGSGCSSSPNGSLGGTTSATVSSGTATFSNISYSYPETISLQASDGTHTVCTNATQIYTTLSVNPAASSEATVTGDILTITGGVPSVSANVTNNQSGGSLGSIAACGGNNCVTYTTGALGSSAHFGAINDTVTITDGAGNTTSTTLNITGPRVSFTQSGTYSYGYPSADTNQTFTVKNFGTTTSGTLTVTLTGVVDGTYSISTDNCSGFTLASNASCTIIVDFLAISSGAPDQQTFTANVGVTTSISSAGTGGGGSSFTVSGEAGL